jgi:hypothetical protein
VAVRSYNPFGKGVENQFYEIDANSTKVKGYYADKLKNMNGYQYKVGAVNEFPYFYVINQKIKGMNWMLIREIARHQNAKIKLFYLGGQDKYAKLRTKLSQRQIDLTIFTHTKLTEFDKSMERINIFATDGFCALLPYPQRKSFFDFVLKPFDLWTWICIIATVFCLVLVWHLSKHSNRNTNSAGFFLFGFFAFFLGQGVEFRDLRRVQMLIVQLMIFFCFIFGNLYQSELISLMSESRYGERISTIQDMISSDYSFKVDPVFNHMIQISNDCLQQTLNISGTFMSEHFHRLAEVSANRSGIILTCKNVDSLYLNTAGILNVTQRTIDYFYRVPEKLYLFYVEFTTAPYSPFASRLQDYSLRFFESGVRQHWSTLLSFEDMSVVKQRESEANEDFLLKFDDTLCAFYCLGIGLAVALAAFVSEHLSQKEVWRRCRGQHRVAPMKPSFIRVQPREPATPQVADDEIEVYELV